MESAAQHQCQFSGESCSTESTHYRKVISHIFGRNKKCTVNVPDSVWIYYCRKHYQRARYRTGEWPFRQCDLAIDTIHNMRAWGGVESFNLKLRRRESRRPSSGAQGNDHDHQQNQSLPSSPQQEQGQLLLQPADRATASLFTAINEAPSSPEKPVDTNITESDSADEQATGSLGGQGVLAANNTNNGSGNDSNKKKRSPRSIPRPVPDWLHDRVGNNVSFDDTLQVLRDLRDHLLQVSGSGEQAHFPDIEVLPNLRRQVSSRQPKKARVSRVSSRGSVTKVDKK